MRKTAERYDMKSRNITFDILRILACFMVVLMHSPMPDGGDNGAFLVAVGYATAPSIGLFFMLSGALLLPVKMPYFCFLRKRFSKILIPTFIWSIVYLGIKAYDNELGNGVLQALVSIPFSAQGTGVLWFMYTLSGLYLLAPVLSPWVEKASRREFQFVLVLWCVTLCYSILDFVVLTNATTTGILYYFTGYAGYFLLGCYLRRHPDSISTLICGTIAALGVVLLLAFKHYNLEFDFFKLFWYQSIFIAAFGIVIYKSATYISKYLNEERIKWGYRILTVISNTTFGIYLIHILVMRYWLWHQSWILSITNYPLQCLAIAIITMLISTLLCLLIASMPYAEWLIGYRLKKKLSNG